VIDCVVCGVAAVSCSSGVSRASSVCAYTQHHQVAGPGLYGASDMRKQSVAVRERTQIGMG